MTKTIDSELGDAAAALDLELRRCEQLAGDARKIPLNSEKNLNKAARALAEAAESQEKVAGHVRVLVGAINGARERQQTNANALHEHAQKLQGRIEQLQELMRRFAALGEEAKAINAIVVETTASKREGPAATIELLSKLDEIQARMSKAVDDAEDLSTTADAQDMVDIARSADSLRQQILAARNKVGLLRQTLSPVVTNGN